MAASLSLFPCPSSSSHALLEISLTADKLRQRQRCMPQVEAVCIVFMLIKPLVSLILCRMEFIVGAPN